MFIGWQVFHEGTRPFFTPELVERLNKTNNFLALDAGCCTLRTASDTGMKYGSAGLSNGNNTEYIVTTKGARVLLLIVGEIVRLNFANSATGQLLRRPGFIIRPLCDPDFKMAQKILTDFSTAGNGMLSSTSGHLLLTDCYIYSLRGRRPRWILGVKVRLFVHHAGERCMSSVFA